MSGLLVIISAPSGGGKTTVISRLLEELPSAARLVTTTTRLPRPGESDGVDYHFITRGTFQNKIQKGDFVEWVEFAGAFYGTDRHEVEQLLVENQFVFANVDVRGKDSLVAAGFPCLSIFLMPESEEILRARLARRPRATEAYIASRLARAAAEVAVAPTFDYQVVNREGQLAETLAQIQEILDKSTETR